MDRVLPADLARDITACGYFPHLVADTVALALGDERVEAHTCHHEATFEREAVARHLTVLVLTPTRLLVVHTDETEEAGGGAAATTSESIPLHQVNSVSLTRIVRSPENRGAPRTSQIAEAWLTLGWGTVRKVDLEPASCNDPTCEADHGYTGDIANDDLALRVSSAAHGPQSVADLVGFATRLQRATGTRA